MYIYSNDGVTFTLNSASNSTYILITLTFAPASSSPEYKIRMSYYNKGFQSTAGKNGIFYLKPNCALPPNSLNLTYVVGEPEQII
jgi:hypothetical protein